ncbi:MAG: hypothetical protein QW785_02690 [Candidatus Anstonellales archaeon]
MLLKKFSNDSYEVQNKIDTKISDLRVKHYLKPSAYLLLAGLGMAIYHMGIIRDSNILNLSAILTIYSLTELEDKRR